MEVREFHRDHCLSPATYMLKNETGKIVYVGSSSTGLYTALSHGLVGRVKSFDTVELIYPDEGGPDLDDLVAELILQHQPKYNVSVPGTRYVTLQEFRDGLEAKWERKVPLRVLREQVRELDVEAAGTFNGRVYYRRDDLENVEERVQ